MTEEERRAVTEARIRELQKNYSDAKAVVVVIAVSVAILAWLVLR